MTNETARQTRRDLYAALEDWESYTENKMQKLLHKAMGIEYTSGQRDDIGNLIDTMSFMTDQDCRRALDLIRITTATA